VVLAAEPHALVGVDLAAPLSLRATQGRGAPAVGARLAGLQNQFAPLEVWWAAQQPQRQGPLLGAAAFGPCCSAAGCRRRPRPRRPPPPRRPQWQRLQALASAPAQQEQAFLQLWALKESFAKALGLGLGLAPLSKAVFSVGACRQGAGGRATARASLLLDGQPAPE
jgi:hypothetical protein